MTKHLLSDDPVAICYWLYDESCAQPEDSGYVGVCRNLGNRLATHRRDFGSYKGAIGTPAANLKAKILMTGTLSECHALERSLRPATGIGWNRYRGGRRKTPGDLAHPYIPVAEPKTRKGILQSKETKAKISEANKHHWSDPEARARLSEAVKKSWQIRKANKTDGPMHHAGKGISKSPEHREKIRQASLRRWAKPAEKARMLNIMKETLNSPDRDRSGQNNPNYRGK